MCFQHCFQGEGWVEADRQEMQQRKTEVKYVAGLTAFNIGERATGEYDCGCLRSEETLAAETKAGCSQLPKYPLTISSPR